MKVLLSVLVALAAAGNAEAEIVFSNLNTSSSAAVGSGFTAFAQRFTTLSAGLGFQLDLNVVSLTGSQPYSVELWSADQARTNVDSLLTTIGSGIVTSSDRTAITSYTVAYNLAAATDYFVKINSATGSFGLVLGPSTSDALNSVLRYGVGTLNNTTSSATAMQVTVAPVPEPSTVAMALVGLACGGVSMGRRRRRS